MNRDKTKQDKMGWTEILEITILMAMVALAILSIL